MKILLLGDRGYLGSYLKEHLDCDVLDQRNVYSNGKEYDYVINCIGKPNLEYCELNKEETWYSNSEVVKDIHRFYPNAKIINFSSYYVYDDEGDCTENSKTTDKYAYCAQKLKSEELTTYVGGVSFRVGKLFGNLDIDKQNKLTEFIIKNDKLELDSVIFNPTSLKQVLDVVIWELENKSLVGVYNLSNLGYISHYNWGFYIKYFLDVNKEIKIVNKQSRSFDNYGRFRMSTTKLFKKVPLRRWQEDLVEYLIEIKKLKNGQKI